MDTLIRALSAAKDGRNYTKHEEKLWEKWHVRFDQLKTFKEMHGHCNVPHSYEPNKKLGAWVGKQRDSYNKQLISQEKVDLLESIGFVWSRRVSHNWEEMYNNLEAYREVRYEPNKKLGGWVGTQRARYNEQQISQEKVDLLESIGFVWNCRVSHWEDMYNNLKAYREVHGHCNVSLYDPDKKLGRWVSIQRKFYKEKRMSQDRINLLESIGFIWSMKEAHWDEMYQKLKAYKEEHGNIDVKEMKNDPENNALVSFIAGNLEKYRKCSLLEDQKALLDAIDFVWDSPAPPNRQDQWNRMYAELKKFKEEYGHCSPPEKLRHAKEKSPYAELSNWAQRQRECEKTSKLTEERKHLLDDLGFPWDPKESRWDTMYQELLKYKQEVGDCDVPKDWSQNVKLATWVRSQRSREKANKLSEERRSRLVSVGFTFRKEGMVIRKANQGPCPNNQFWDAMLQRLLEYKNQNGDCLVPKGYPADVTLANWVRNNRQQYKKNKLSQERIARLEEIGFAFTIGAGKYKRKNKVESTPVDAESEYHDVDFGMSSLAETFEDDHTDDAAAEEENSVQEHHNENTSVQQEDPHIQLAHYLEENEQLAEENRRQQQENERLAEENRRQADEIAQLRSQLMYRPYSML